MNLNFCPPQSAFFFFTSLFSSSYLPHIPSLLFLCASFSDQTSPCFHIKTHMIYSSAFQETLQQNQSFSYSNSTHRQKELPPLCCLFLCCFHGRTAKPLLNLSLVHIFFSEKHQKIQQPISSMHVLLHPILTFLKSFLA